MKNPKQPTDMQPISHLYEEIWFQVLELSYSIMVVLKFSTSLVKTWKKSWQNEDKNPFLPSGGVLTLGFMQ